MSGGLLDIEFADINIFKELGVFSKEMFRNTHFALQKKLQNMQFVVQQTCTDLCGTVVVWIKVCLQMNVWMVNILQKEQVNTRFFQVSWMMIWKIWMIMAVPKFKISLMKKCGFVEATHSDTRPHSTVQSARENCLVTG